MQTEARTALGKRVVGAPELVFACNAQALGGQVLLAYRECLTSIPEELREPLIAIWSKAKLASSEGMDLFSGSITSFDPFREDEQRAAMAAVKAAVLLMPEFKKLQAEAEASAPFLRDEWNRGLEESTAVMRDITGLDFSNRRYAVHVLHPGLPAGSFWGDSIEWRHIGAPFERFADTGHFPNYNTVYLWHEIMHGELGSSNLEHAVIQLATDNELRIRLNGGSYPPLVGHPWLKAEMEVALDAWRSYLAADGPRDIRRFCEGIMAGA